MALSSQEILAKSRASQKRWREANPEYNVQRQRNWYQENRWYMRSRWLLKRYGLTTEQYDAKLLAQGSCCMICQSPEPGSKNGWHIDHDHVTRTTRDILCQGCNLGLGNFKDDLWRLRAAAAYIERHDLVQALIDLDG